jgi:thiol-disulfide isomerase/thioredoxin
MLRYLIVWALLLVPSLHIYSQEKHIDPLPIGAAAPAFTLPGVDGKTYSLDDFSKNDILVVIFTCNHCPTAQAYEDRIINIVKDYKERNVGFVAISPNSPQALSLSELGYSDMGDDPEDMKLRAKEKQFDFPYLYDGETQEVSMKYGPQATPHVFIFNKERILKYSGRIDDNENPYAQERQNDMRNAIDALLNHKEVEVPVTKTFGCSIKWSWKNEWTRKLQQDWSMEPVQILDLNTDSLRLILSNKTDKLILVNFWASWCGPCVMEMPTFVEINRMYRNRDFNLITISLDKYSKKESVMSILKKAEASCINYIFTGDTPYEVVEIADPEWTGPIPYTMLIAPGGEIIYRKQAEINPYLLKKTIVNYLGRYYADDK